jgi:hypothetical protein
LGNKYFPQASAAAAAAAAVIPCAEKTREDVRHGAVLSVYTNLKGSKALSDVRLNALDLLILSRVEILFSAE